jgi:serine/threonine-protein kinase RsbW
MIVVRDPGQGFKASEVPNPLATENLESNHGRGIYLINQLMDEVSFERNGAEIRMRKTIAGPGSEPAPTSIAAASD